MFKTQEEPWSHNSCIFPFFLQGLLLTDCLFDKKFMFQLRCTNSRGSFQSWSKFITKNWLTWYKSMSWFSTISYPILLVLSKSVPASTILVERCPKGPYITKLAVFRNCKIFVYNIVCSQSTYFYCISVSYMKCRKRTWTKTLVYL